MSNVTIIRGASDSTVADWLAQDIARGLAATADNVAICVPGGSTPFPILTELSLRPLDWRRVEVWPGDDRIVHEDSPYSNAGRIRRLLEPRGARVIALSDCVQPPHFALCWLGMGTDGHVASLFPSLDPQTDDPLPLRRSTPDPLPPEAPFDRLTLTIPALLDCDTLMFVIRGEDKLALFEAAAAGLCDLPVTRLLRAATMPVTCFT